jgi:hypothetical protein
MKLCGGTEPPFLTLALYESEGSASHPDHFTIFRKTVELEVKKQIVESLTSK